MSEVERRFRLLPTRADPAHLASGQHQAEHLVEHRAAGEGLVERLLQARGIIAMHAREEIRNRQGVGLYPKDLAGQRRPAQQRGVLIHVPRADTPDLVRQAQLGMAGLQLLGHRLLAAGTAADGVQQHQQHHDVGQHDRHRGLQVRPPGCQHVLVGQPDLYRQRTAFERADGEDARHAVDDAGHAAQLDHCLRAEQVPARQVIAAAHRAMRIGYAGQHVALGIADRDQSVGTDIQAADDALQFATAQPCQQPAPIGHRQRQRDHPAPIAGALRRADVQRAARAAPLRIGPQRQLQVALAGRQCAAIAVEHHDAVQFGVPAQHAADGRIEQGRRLRRHTAEQFRGIGGDAGHGPLQVAQLQGQQALAAHRQRAALPLRRFQAAVVVVDQHQGQAGHQQHAHQHAAPGNGAQRPGQRPLQRGHRLMFLVQSAGFMRERILHVPDLNGRRTPFLTPDPVLHGHLPVSAQGSRVQHAPPR